VVPFEPEQFDPTLEPESLPEPAKPPETERPRRRRGRRGGGSSAESETTRESNRPHGRAGEPGYVPRRVREGETPFESEPSSAAELDWVDLGRPAEDEDLFAPPEREPSSELLGEEETTSRAEGKRRRRRRGRRRERPEREAPESTAETEPRAPSRERFPDLAERDAIDELDFDDATDILEDEDEAAGLLHEHRALPTEAEAEEAIDPELEEEIRREIEEIAELERELGLRGPVEARHRRSEDRGEPAEAAPRAGRAPRGRGAVKPPIQEIFRRGDEVLVQVIKESIGTKGPTLSTYISIPGRYLVLMPGLNRVGVSRKIADEAQRRKLREIMNELNPPKGLGFIVRTAGLDRSKRELARDLAYLLRLWKVILRRIKKAKAPAPIYQESDMITRTIRDIFSESIDTIWIDEPQAFERAQEFLRVVMPRFVNRLRLYEEKVPLFHKYGIEDEIAKIQRRHVPLPEGGSIVIDQTEALVAIDVNSGNFRVENDAERTAYEMNLRAAKEIARQLRLRDLGGVIVNDFIDMREERNRRGVERALREAIKRDRARTKILRMSQFGLIEMTRQRIRPSLKRSVFEDCSHCNGTGVIKTAESMAIDVMRLLALASHREEIQRVNLTVAAPVALYLNNRKRREIARIESEANLSIHIRHEEHAPAEFLQIDCFDAQNNEIRLVPPAQPPARRGR
jgi:ribonuclease E